MKPTQITELLANIRATAVSFFSILMFVALGVGIFLGIFWSGPALFQAADAHFETNKFHHFQIAYPYGIPADEVAEIAALDGVDAAEGIYAAIMNAQYAGTGGYVKVQSLPTSIDTLELLEGDLPTATDEVAVLQHFADDKSLALGDVLELHNIDAETALFRPASVRVVGIVRSPEYISENPMAYGQSGVGSGELDGILYAPVSAFDESAFQQAFPLVNVRFANLDAESTFDSAYKTTSRAREETLEQLGATLAPQRFAAIHNAAQAEIDKAQESLDSAREQLDAAETQESEGEAQLADARDQIAEGSAKLEQSEEDLALISEKITEGEAKVAAGEAELAQRSAEAQAQLDDAKWQLDNAEAQINAAQAQLDDAKAQLSRAEGVLEAVNAAEDMLRQQGAEQSDIDEYENMGIEVYGQTMSIAQLRAYVSQGEAELAAAETELSNAQATFAQKQQEYNDARVEAASKIGEAQGRIADAREQLEAAREQEAQANAKLEAGKQQIEEGKQQLSEKERELEAGKQKIEEGEEEYAEKTEQLSVVRDELAAMKEYAWTVMPRALNGGVSEATVLGSVTNNLSFSMAMLFVIVGLLVCYSAVSRIVHEQVSQIGTKKALGLRASEITKSYLGYSGMAVVLGAIIGTVMAVVLVQGIINPVLQKRFYVGAYPPYMGAVHALVVFAIELALVLGATWLACRGVLKKHAVELLRGEEPPKAKQRFFEKWALWNKLPLFTQTMVNNCLNDKRRVFSTVVGVAGCTALIVTAITLNNDILKSYDVQYSDIYGFDSIAYTKEAGDAAQKAAVQLKAEGVNAAAVHLQRFAITQEDGSKAAVRMVVPDNAEDFANIYHIEPYSAGQVDLDGFGVWVSRAYAEHLGAQVGDTITIDSGTGTVHRVPIAGFYDFRLSFLEMVMGKALYAQEFGAEPSYNALLFDASSSAGQDAWRNLAASQDFETVVDDKTKQGHNFTSFAGISRSVVAIYLLLAVLMAIVVLLNLNVMFIDEKKRELIVLMINGFSTKDAERYIANDTIVLTVLGIILGVVLGAAMGAYTVASVEPSVASFIKAVDWPAVGIGVLGSAVLAFVMAVIALRRIPRFSLTDINRM